MAYLTVAKLKEVLGITDPVTPQQAGVLVRSVSMASTLISGYIGWDPTDVTQWREYSTTMENWQRSLQLPYWPAIEVKGISMSGEPLLGYEDGNYGDGWWLDKTHAIIEDLNFSTAAVRGNGRYGNRVTVIYTAGYSPVPHELRDVAINLACSIYESDGIIATPGDGGVGSGELKSLTMFDAMSMSFDTGSTTNKGGAQQMAAVWGFVLDKYKRNGPVLA